MSRGSRTGTLGRAEYPQGWYGGGSGSQAIQFPTKNLVTILYFVCTTARLVVHCTHGSNHKSISLDSMGGVNYSSSIRGTTLMRRMGNDRLCRN
jgi:hypothetical protein